jgi:pyruvate,water dikinase
MAEFLIRLGIDSMSLNPDTVVKTTGYVLEGGATARTRPMKAGGSPHS